MNEINKIWYIKWDDMRKSIYWDIFKKWSRSKWANFHISFDNAEYFERFDNWWGVYREGESAVRLLDSKRLTPTQWFYSIYDWDRAFYDWEKIIDEEVELTEEEIKTAIENLTKLVYKKWREDWAKWMREIMKSFHPISRLLNKF